MTVTSGGKLHIHLLNVVVRSTVFLNSATQICRDTDISKCLKETLGIQDNESRLYLNYCIILYLIYPKYWEKQASANTAGPDQIPQNALPDQVYCLPLIQKVLGMPTGENMTSVFTIYIWTGLSTTLHLIGVYTVCHLSSNF